MLEIHIQQHLGELDLAVNVEIPTQGVTAIFGRSGAGKSSLINVVAGLARANYGRISLNGRVLFDAQQGIHLAPEKRRVGYVFQEPRLFPHYSVEKNLKYGCKRSNSALFLQIVQLLGIEPLLSRFPNTLSGGEKQRVAIGRALLSEPDILLMDEPLSALDLPRKKELLDYLSELATRVEIPILYVSHSLDEVARLADFMLLLENGKVTAFDRTTVVWHSPAFAQWQPDGQQSSLLELPMVDFNPHYQLTALALGNQRIWLSGLPAFRAGERVRVSVPAGEVIIAVEPPPVSSILNVLHGTVCKILLQTDRLQVGVDVEGLEIWATISHWAFETLQLSLGKPVYLLLKNLSH